MLPFVSCVCPTFNRPPGYLHLLEEAVESFRRQTYSGSRRELVLVNTTPGQTLTCSVPNVRILNLACRPDTLGEARNFGTVKSVGTVLLPWDDDDISLPGRISDAVRELMGGLASGFLYDYYKPSGYYWFNCGKLSVDHSIGVCHNCSAFTRDAWDRVGGYPLTSGNDDLRMDELLRDKVRTKQNARPESWQYLYRWGVSPRHLSGVSEQVDGKADHNPHYRRIGLEPVVGGSFDLKPVWQEEYDHMCRRLLYGAREQQPN